MTKSSSKRAGAIDIGSNSILLTIAEPGTESAIPLTLLHDEANVTGLSKGILQGGVIADDRKHRSGEVLKHYRDVLQKLNVQNTKVTGTEAFRKAQNGTQVKKEFESILNSPIEIISGDREAELSFWSVQKEFKKTQEPKIVFDIGGASTELCLGDHRGIQERVSLKVGSVVLSEKFGLLQKASATEALAYVRSLLQEVPWITKSPQALGIGVAGTITTLFAMEQKLQTFNRQNVHGKSIDRDRLEYWMKWTLERDAKERASIPGLTLDRADVISGGFCIAFALAHYFRWDDIVCMDSGVRFGILYELLDI